MIPVRALRRGVLVSALVLSLAGCNVVGMIYKQLDWLIPYQLETYVDFSGAQSAFLDQQLSAVLTWHCQSHLPQYAALLRVASEQFQSGAIDRTLLTSHSQQIRAYWLEILNRAKPAISGVLLIATDDQVDELFAVFEEQNEEWLEDYQAKSDGEIRDAYVENMSEELERWFGPLEDGQADAVRDWSLRFQPLGMLGFEMRQRWQQRLADVLEQRSAPEAFDAGIDTLLFPSERNRPAEMIERLKQNHTLTIDLIYAVGSSITAEQRDHLARFSEGLADDLEDIECSF